jgi:hypothetical protein
LRDPRERSEQLDTVRAEPKRGARAEPPKRRGDPEGGIRIALGAAGKSCFEVLARGGLRSQDRLPPQLGNRMALDLTDSLCGDSPNRADIGQLCLTAVDEPVTTAHDISGALVQ